MSLLHCQKAVSLENRPDACSRRYDHDRTAASASGTLDFEELVEVYKKQAQSLMQAGVDLITVETMMSLQESRAALIAIRKLDLPGYGNAYFCRRWKDLIWN